MKFILGKSLLLIAGVIFTTQAMAMTLAKEIKNAMYWVPVDKSLARYAAFPIANMEISKENGVLKIEYTVPFELTGKINEIEFEGPLVNSGTVELKSSHGEMSCPDVDQLQNCQIKYENLKFDFQALTGHLASISKTKEELASRIKVAEVFSTEPIGFFSIGY